MTTRGPFPDHRRRGRDGAGTCQNIPGEETTHDRRGGREGDTREACMDRHLTLRDQIGRYQSISIAVHEPACMPPTRPTALPPAPPMTTWGLGGYTRARGQRAWHIYVTTYVYIFIYLYMKYVLIYSHIGNKT